MKRLKPTKPWHFDQNNPDAHNPWQAWREECETQYSHTIQDVRDALLHLCEIDADGLNDTKGQSLVEYIDAITSRLEEAKQLYKEAGKRDWELNAEIEEKLNNSEEPKA